MNATSTVSVRVEGGGDQFVTPMSACMLLVRSLTGWAWARSCRRRSQRGRSAAGEP